MSAYVYFCMCVLVFVSAYVYVYVYRYISPDSFSYGGFPLNRGGPCPQPAAVRMQVTLRSGAPCPRPVEGGAAGQGEGRILAHLVWRTWRGGDGVKWTKWSK